MCKTHHIPSFGELQCVSLVKESLESWILGFLASYARVGEGVILHVLLVRPDQKAKILLLTTSYAGINSNSTPKKRSVAEVSY